MNTTASNAAEPAGPPMAAPGDGGDGRPPAFPDLLGHPRPLWMLFATEFWERFSFYGMRWALTLYIVAQFYNGEGRGEGPANVLYGAYLALVYAAAIFGGYVADRIIGYQRSILTGALIMGAGLFMLVVPNEQIFQIGLATVIVGNGLFKPNISTMVGKLYAVDDERRDSGFTIFYMGINLGAMIAPLLTGWFASRLFGTEEMPLYKSVFISTGFGMLVSFVWFWFGRRQLNGIGRPPLGKEGMGRVAMVLVGAAVAVPATYFLLTIGAGPLNWFVLLPMFVLLSVLLLAEGMREGAVQRDKVIAMLIIFIFNVLFWCFFEQAGSSFNFLAEKIVDRDFSGWIFPVAWFQSVNSLAIISLAPLLAWLWVRLAKVHPSQGAMRGVRVVVALASTVFSIMAMHELSTLGLLTSWQFYVLAVLVLGLGAWATKIDFGNPGGTLNPSVPRKFAFGLIFNGFAFLLLMFALTKLVDDFGKIPFWTLFMVYVIQSVGELCLSPIGLSMVTKLAPVRLVGFAMGGWFLSTGIGNNLSGIFASHVSGATGMTTTSALTGYTLGFWILAGFGVLLFLIAPLVQRLMHGVK
jgi:POT family proton-dependent oligopeptide transporter